MTYVRKGPDSGVTVFGDGQYLYCASCALNPKGETAGLAEELDSPREMLGHLAKHADAGHKVPERLLQRLTAEAEGRVYYFPLDSEDDDEEEALERARRVYDAAWGALWVESAEKFNYRTNDARIQYCTKRATEAALFYVPGPVLKVPSGEPDQ